MLRKRRERLGVRLFAHVIFGIHEAENFRRCAERLLEIVVEERELADRIVQLEHGDDEREKRSGGERADA